MMKIPNETRERQRGEREREHETKELEFEINQRFGLTKTRSTTFEVEVFEMMALLCEKVVEVFVFL
jgi:hypothetical protein